MTKKSHQQPVPIIYDILRNPDLVSLLRSWAGETIFKRGLDYYHQNRIKELALSGDGSLLATAHGSKDYVCSIYLDEDNTLAGDCTCPYDDICKHIVALALQARASLDAGKPPPSCSELDFRLDKLEATCRSAPPVRQSALKRALAKLTHEKLLDLLLQACERDEDFALFCAVAADPDKLGIRALINDTKNAISSVASFDYAEEIEPDYFIIAQKLDAITEAGRPEATLELAKDVFATCSEAIDNSDYTGQMIEGVCEVAVVSLDALEAVDWPPAKKLIWTLKAMLQDEFGYTEPFEEYHREITDTSAWAEASQFLEKLSAQSLESISDTQLSSLRKMALNKSGQPEAVLSLYEQEAQKNRDYCPIVKYLLTQKNDAAAEQWIKKGLRAAKASYQIRALRDYLIDIRERAGDLDSVIALETEKFVESPSVSSWQDCAKAAENAGLWKVLKPLLTQFLVTGKLPWDESAWPCQLKGAADATRHSFPLYHELIDLAIHEKRPQDALKWHDRQRASGTGRCYSETRLAEAIKGIAPARAMAIWQREAERIIPQTDSRSYFEAGELIGKILALAKNMEERKRWIPWLLSLRELHKRKKNFIKILDSVERKHKIAY